MGKCDLDLDDPNFCIFGDASDAELQVGLKELQEKLTKDHKLSKFFNQPMQHFPEYQNKIWKWDFAPGGDKSSTRKGWRLFAYVPDARAPEPILARAFLCYDKDQAPKGDHAKFLAGMLKKFLSRVINVEATADRFRRQTNSDGRIISLCYECCDVMFSADEDEATLAEGAHECPPKAS